MAGIGDRGPGLIPGRVPATALALPWLTREFEMERVGEVPLPRSSEESALELMPRGGLVLCWGLDLPWVRMGLQEPGKSHGSTSHPPRAASHLSFRRPLSIKKFRLTPVNKYRPRVTFPCNLERRKCPLKMVLLVFVSHVILASLLRANGKDRGLWAKVGSAPLAFARFFWVAAGADGESLVHVAWCRATPGDGVGSGVVLRGGCSRGWG